MTMRETRHTAERGAGRLEADDPHPVALLVERARRGEQPAWDAIVGRYTALLWTIARGHRLSHADAADAVQLSWLRCVEHLHRIREPDRLAGWLVVTCHRECLRIMRMAGRVTPVDAADPLGLLALAADSQISDPASIAVAHDEASIVRAAIAELPDRWRPLLVALLDGADSPKTSYAEIAGALDIPIGSIGPTRQRALRRLRRDPHLRALRTSGRR